MRRCRWRGWIPAGRRIVKAAARRRTARPRRRPRSPYSRSCQPLTYSPTPPENTRAGKGPFVARGSVSQMPASSSGRPDATRSARSAIRSATASSARSSRRSPAMIRTPASPATRSPARVAVVMVPAASHANSRAPMSSAAVSSTRPSRQTASFVVPPPMSMLSTSGVAGSRDLRTAPDPCAASRLSRWCPAVAHTNLPAWPLNSATMAPAFSWRAASPVVITAPVSTSSGAQPASRYERSMKAPSASVSMRRPDAYGVRDTSERWMTFRSTTPYALGQQDPLALEHDLREDQVRRRRADVDADGAQAQTLGGHVPFVATVIVPVVRVRMRVRQVLVGPRRGL